MAPARPRFAQPKAAAITTLILAAQLVRYPSPLRDGVSGCFIKTFSLEYPLGYVLTTPLSAYADLITFNSARQDIILVVYLVLAYWVWRAVRPCPLVRCCAEYVLYLALVVGFIAWAILCPRPAARLRLVEEDALALDFHSHTNRSWDGRRSYDPLANIEWHRRMGFTAGFITDHNTTSGAEEAQAFCRPSCDGYRSLMGEEVSLHDAHVGVLGPSKAIDNTLYNRDLAGLKTFLGSRRALNGGLAVLNLPEYWLHHWSRIESLAQWGAAGIEIVNAVPKALDFPESKKRQVIELCRRRHIFFVGVSDNHGWGSANFVWNIMNIPGQAAMGSEELQKAVLARLRKEGADAIQVVTRVKHPPSQGFGILWDPLLSLWTCLRTLSLSQALACLAWVWGGALIPARRWVKQ